jgi:cation diffusion facilitator CzcD-associated flavoprotein CzcO
MTETLDSTPPSTNGAAPAERHVRIAIVGTGFAGLGMAIRLREAGIEDFVILERADDVGGTWQANTYPGCQCDVPSHLYSLSFAPNPDWSRTYSKQPEIWEYLRRLARDRGLTDHVRFGCEVLDAQWHEDEQRWHVATSRGDLTATVLIGATGPLVDPVIPAIAGLNDFQGTIFHSARWDHEHDLTGERVAVIGTGASAIQFVPQIQPRVGRMHVFQRTPPWIMPHSDRPISDWERTVYRRMPLAQKAVRAGIYWARELMVLGMAKYPALLKPMEFAGRRHLRRQVPDPALRAKLAPDYTVGCKRILPSNKYLPAIASPNVELVTDGVREVKAHSIVTADGTEREVDTIILGTGFHVTDPPIAQRLRGADGRTMAEAAAGSPQAYLGTAVPGFPNLFMLIGPNTGLGHSSMVFMIESQLAYVMDALRTMEQRDVGAVEVRREVAEAYNRQLQEMMPGTVWLSGCSSWYLDANGRNTTVWPDFTFKFRQRLRRFDAPSYDLRARRPAPAAVA